MSLTRWSLPSRAFNREKSQDSDSSQRRKFPTIHIGNPRARRRANLSSAFASLFDKDENHQTPILPNDDDNVKELLPLSARVENIPSPRLKDGKVDTRVHQPDTSNCPSPQGRVSGLFTKQYEIPKPSYPPTSLNEHGPQVRSYTTGAIRSPMTSTSMRSASSSYPSEGLHSPPGHSISPQLNILPESYMSEMTPYGAHPVRDGSDKSTISTIDISAPNSDRGGQCLIEELAAVGGMSDTETRTTSRDCANKPPLSDITTIGSSREPGDDSSQTCHDSDPTTMPKREAIGAPFAQGNGIHLSDGQFSSTSAVCGSFLELESPFHHGSSEEEYTCRPTNAGSLDRLRQSTEVHEASNEIGPTKIQWVRCSTMPASIPQKSPLRDRLAITAAHFDNQNLPGLHFRGSSDSSNNLVHRIHKFKLRKWIKKVCLRTKVRFDNVIRIEVLSPKKSRRKSNTQKLQRAKKNKALKAKSKPKKVHWKRFEKKAKNPEGRRHRFKRSLKKKNSIQLPIQESVQDKSSLGHRRIQSCPS
ncbi:hypothetical protein F5B19DRAFT_439280 [Rostrohypoxylon terebratum]|nr:hypothetical protein F5B19DRAFT_439280 [Rostrohypoxylon terebratum]